MVVVEEAGASGKVVLVTGRTGYISSNAMLQLLCNTLVLL
jgi:hypothetical protein